MPPLFADAVACEDCEPVPWWAFWDSRAFVPRSHCDDWTDSLISAWVIPSVGLFLAYLAIAAILVIAYIHNRDRVSPRRGLLWIAAFFVGCGGGHIINAVAFVWPAYRLFILWDWYTLITSGVGAVAVFRIYRWMMGRIRHAETERDAACKKLQAMIDREIVVTVSEAEEWKAGRTRVLNELLSTLKGLA